MVAVSIYNQRIREARKDEELEEMATKDTITGLYSYPYFLEQCAAKIKNEELKGGIYSYLFINLRHFKIFNDQKGYIEGNKLLKDVGDILRECLGEEALLTRQSDDHFMAFTRTGRIVEKIDRAAEMVLERTPIVKVGLNAGACLLLDTLDDPIVGIEKARYACSEIKIARKKENVIFFDKRMHDNAMKAQYVATHIDEAIQNGWIKAYFQPVVWSKGRELCGVEALARWIDPKFGFLSASLPHKKFLAQLIIGIPGINKNVLVISTIKKECTKPALYSPRVIKEHINMVIKLTITLLSLILLNNFKPKKIITVLITTINKSVHVPPKVLPKPNIATILPRWK